MSYPDGLREEVDAYLAELPCLDGGPGPGVETAGLRQAMGYAVLGGGKRIRPVLCLATGTALGIEDEWLMPAAAAIEMIHTYSLIHDDLPAMDDDDLRRGRPTVHVEFGEAVAILAGDALFAEAIALIAEGPWGPDGVVEAIRVLSSAAGVDGMVGGQYIDVTTEDLDAEGLDRLHGLKTGGLISASVQVPLALAGTPAGPGEPFLAFAGELGILFQIVDDILDVTGSAQETGKPQGSDERHGKITYVSLHGLERARELAAESHRRAIGHLDRVDADTGALRGIADFIHERDR